MGFFGVGQRGDDCENCFCEHVPTDVESSCDVSDCDESLPDGVGMTATALHGGSVAISTDPDYGRPGPGFLLDCSQSGSDGVFAAVLSETVWNQGARVSCFPSASICGEFLKGESDATVRVWGCLFQNGTAYVDGSTPTGSASVSAWRGMGSVLSGSAFSVLSSVSEVTGFSSSGISVGSGHPTEDDDFYLGFLVQVLGADGESRSAYLDNVCISAYPPCPWYDCTGVMVTISGLSAGVYDGHPNPSCDVDSWDVSTFNSLVNGTFFVPYNGSLFDQQEWRSDPAGIGPGSHLGSGIYLDLNLGWFPGTANLGFHLRSYIIPSGCAGSWVIVNDVNYGIDRADFACETPMEYYLTSDNLPAYGMATTHPPTITVEFIRV